MRTVQRSLTAGMLGLAVLLGACGDSAGDDPAIDNAIESLGDVITQEEADDAATSAITDENADAEMAKLTKEIEAGN